MRASLGGRLTNGLEQRQSRKSPLTDQPLPLVLDVDGALLRTDLLWESLIVFLKSAPWRIFAVLAWLAKGRAALKARLARQVDLDVAPLPINDALVAYAASEHAAGRRVHLATAADDRLARAVARRFSFVDGVYASDGARNLKGPEKARALSELFPDGFIYAGDSHADLPIWRIADGIVLAGAPPSVAREAAKIGAPLANFPPPDRLKATWKALRPHQWAKNALLFVPLVLGGAGLDMQAVATTLLAFVGLSLVASATYVFNDLIDLADDRRHWTKRERPLASGALSIPAGIMLALLSFSAGLGFSALAGPGVILATLAYAGGTLAYSLNLKRIPLVDVAMLAGLFTLRLFVGVVAADVVLSSWLLTFSMFLFLSLSLAKRHTELKRSSSTGRGTLAGRGYGADDEPLVLALGVGALMAAVLVFVLYLTQEAFAAAYLAAPKLLWAFPPALFLMSSRIWLMSARGALDDDPVAFAVKDRASLATLAVLAVVFLLAWRGLPLP